MWKKSLLALDGDPINKHFVLIPSASHLQSFFLFHSSHQTVDIPILVFFSPPISLSPAMPTLCVVMLMKLNCGRNRTGKRSSTQEIKNIFNLYDCSLQILPHSFWSFLQCKTAGQWEYHLCDDENQKRIVKSHNSARVRRKNYQGKSSSSGLNAEKPVEIFQCNNYFIPLTLSLTLKSPSFNPRGAVRALSCCIFHFSHSSSWIVYCLWYSVFKLEFNFLSFLPVFSSIPDSHAFIYSSVFSVSSPYHFYRKVISPLSPEDSQKKRTTHW